MSDQHQHNAWEVKYAALKRASERDIDRLSRQLAEMVEPWGDPWCGHPRQASPTGKPEDCAICELRDLKRAYRVIVGDDIDEEAEHAARFLVGMVERIERLEAALRNAEHERDGNAAIISQMADTMQSMLSICNPFIEFDDRAYARVAREAQDWITNATAIDARRRDDRECRETTATSG